MVNKERYLTYKESKEFCKLKNIKSKTDWFNNKNNIHNGKIVPSNPNKFYSEWISWYDFLDKDKKKFNYFTYSQCKNYIKKFNINSKTEWFKKIKDFQTINIPYDPYKYYSKKGWISWGDFLDTGRIQDNQRQFLSFNEAKKIVHKENINSVKEWKLYCKNKPDNIPAKPWKIYKSEWLNMSDWLNGFSCGSNGEYLVEEYLKKLKVSFKKQYSFDGCLSEKNHKLFFDFYLNELNICIEYDGKQHFEPVEFFGGKKIFNEIKNRDQLKNKFCEDNGIFLLRIPYNKNNDEIEKIIINVINNGKSF